MTEELPGPIAYTTDRPVTPRTEAGRRFMDGVRLHPLTEERRAYLDAILAIEREAAAPAATEAAARHLEVDVEQLRRAMKAVASGDGFSHRRGRLYPGENTAQKIAAEYARLSSAEES